MGDNASSTITPTKGNLKSTNVNNRKKSLLQDKNTGKKKRRAKNDLGDNFVAPDGGWGWFVAIASGVNTLITFAVTQQFGIIFRDHMFDLDITSSQITTIINIHIAVTSITGIFNGPLFRRFSFRQIAVCGSCLSFIGLFACAFADTFLLYILSFSCCYGLGRRLIASASTLALNTYFKKRRRTATSYQFGVAGLGSICLPYVSTILLDYYDAQGTVLCFAAFTLNNIVCSLIYQPVKWHVKKHSPDLQASEKLTLQEEDEKDTPILSPVNDGSLNSKDFHKLTNIKSRLNSCDKHQVGSRNCESKISNSQDSIKNFSSSCSIQKTKHEFNYKIQDKRKQNNKEYKVQEELLPLRKEEKEEVLEEHFKCALKLPWYMKLVEIFDLDLLRDFTYVNLIMGLTLINFVELNFAILTPFILSDFGFDKHQIAFAMTLLGTLDLIIRFLIPLITARINFSNKTFFIFGIMGMCIGRIFLSFTRNFYIMIGIFVWLGFTKAFRTVFWSLIIPGYVPLKRLPAASGLDLLMSGLFSLAFGPIIGLIRDKTSYTFALNFLNALGLLATACWILEDFIRNYRIKKEPVI